MNPHDLMEVARALAESGHAPPTQARLRRAVSTAYYAMFHCLAASAADLFIGTVRSPAWHRTYRALEHGRARSACRQAQAMPEFPVEIRDFADAFVVLQIERQQADYARTRPRTGSPTFWTTLALRNRPSAGSSMRTWRPDAPLPPMCCSGSDRHRRPT